MIFNGKVADVVVGTRVPKFVLIVLEKEVWMCLCSIITHTLVAMLTDCVCVCMFTGDECGLRQRDQSDEHDSHWRTRLHALHPHRGAATCMNTVIFYLSFYRLLAAVANSVHHV